MRNRFLYFGIILMSAILATGCAGDNGLAKKLNGKWYLSDSTTGEFSGGYSNVKTCYNFDYVNDNWGHVIITDDIDVFESVQHDNGETTVEVKARISVSGRYAVKRECLNIELDKNSFEIKIFKMANKYGMEYDDEYKDNLRRALTEQYSDWSNGGTFMEEGSIGLEGNKLSLWSGTTLLELTRGE